MSYIQDNLLPWEKIQIFTKPSWKFDFIWYIAAFFFIFPWLITISDPALRNMWIGTLSIGLLLLLPILARIRTEYVVTDKRVVIKTGIITTKTEELTAAKIETVNVKRWLFDMIFKTGKIYLKWSGGTPKIMRSVDNYNELRTEIYTLSETQWKQ